MDRDSSPQVMPDLEVCEALLEALGAHAAAVAAAITAAHPQYYDLCDLSLSLGPRRSNLRSLPPSGQKALRSGPDRPPLLQLVTLSNP